MKKVSLFVGLLCAAAVASSATFSDVLREGQCVAGNLRASDSSDGMRYSLPVWSDGAPVACGADGGRYLKGRKLTPSEVNTLLEATIAEHRTHLASLKH
nr:hypothetical protein AVHM3334_23415 [Acidovorax sp. SUPP3334]